MNTAWQLIRTRAKRVRQNYAAHVPSSSTQLLDLSDLTERCYQLTVVPTLTLSAGVQGRLEPELQVIRVRRGLAPERMRFVVAHELGHVVLEGLHSAYDETDITLDERVSGGSIRDSTVRTYNTRERHEQDANLFALELLIPANELWQALQQPAWQVADLASQFGVSLDAMRTQIINVSCIEPVRNTLRIPEATTGGVLDPEQQAAVTAALPLLLAAGPGTGKTRSIVAKYMHLVQEHVDPAAILALTFSNKAADEMRSRIVHALEQQSPALAGRVEISTFHAWGMNILRQHAERLGLPPAFRLLDDGDLFQLLGRTIADLGLDHFKDLHTPTRNLLQIIQALGRVKDELRTPAEYALLAEAEAQRRVSRAALDHPRSTVEDTKKRERAAKQAAQLRELAQIYPRYETILRSAGAVDYADLIVLAVQALRDPDIAAELHAQYQFILVDEFQDINYASGELVRLLDGGHSKVWAVGDAWQSIYRFRGASAANIAGFSRQYPNATTPTLSRNYRSFQQILDASTAIMAPDQQAASRPPLVASRGVGGGVRVVEWVGETRQDEYVAFAHDILQRVKKTAFIRPACCPRLRQLPRAKRPCRRVSPRPMIRRWHFSDHAILCRTNGQAARVAAVLEAHGIPVESVRDVFETPEVKDVLAICAQVRSVNDAGFLRAVTMVEHQLSASDLKILVQHARETKQSLPRAARDPTIVALVSPAAQTALARLAAIVAALNTQRDAWQVLAAYLFEQSPTMRARLVRAGRGDSAAQRELAQLGQLLSIARSFVRQALPAQRGAAAFIEYIRTLQAAGATRNQPLNEAADVVRVMTVHGAKGLEFPVVYIPHLQEGQYPHTASWPNLPQPADLIRGPIDDSIQEERYLLYVAMTRARDRLVLSRSLDGGRKPNGELKVAVRSPLLPGNSDGADAPWRVRVLPPRSSCPTPAPEIRLVDTPMPPMPLPASSIDLNGCRRHFLYQYVYQLYDDQTPFLLMHQTIRACIKQLTEDARNNVLCTDEDAVRALVAQQITRYKLDTVLYAEDYADEIWNHVRSLWDELQTKRLIPDQVDTEVLVQRSSGSIAVRVDRVDSSATQPRWVWMRSGQRDENDHLKERVMLYVLAQQSHGDATSAIAIHYSANSDLRTATPQANVLARHTAKIDLFLDQIQARQWPLSEGLHCRSCPFSLICPV